MSLPVVLLLALLQQTLAAPQVIVSQWPPEPPLPSICGVLNEEPACPYGYKCQPFVTRDCDELDDDELCGYCSKIAPKTTYTPTPTLTPTLTTTPTLAGSPTSSVCPSGFTPDYRNYCRPISTTTTSKTPFSCPSGFIPDYRGYSYCRPTYQATPTAQVSSSLNPCPTGMTPDYRGVCHTIIPTTASIPRTICSSGYVIDYRGVCRQTPTSSIGIFTTYVEKREIVTEVQVETEKVH